MFTHPSEALEIHGTESPGDAISPLVYAVYHAVLKLLGGKSGDWHTVCICVYPASPVPLIGWVSYGGGTVAAFWMAAVYPLALQRLHCLSWGLAVLFAGVLMGIQIGCTLSQTGGTESPCDRGW